MQRCLVPDVDVVDALEQILEMETQGWHDFRQPAAILALDKRPTIFCLDDPEALAAPFVDRAASLEATGT